MKSRYAYEKLYLAIIALLPNQSLSKKLLEVNQNYICHIDPINELPPKLQELYNEIENCMELIRLESFDDALLVRTRDNLLTLFCELHLTKGYSPHV